MFGDGGGELTDSLDWNFSFLLSHSMSTLSLSLFLSPPLFISFYHFLSLPFLSSLPLVGQPKGSSVAPGQLALPNATATLAPIISHDKAGEDELPCVPCATKGGMFAAQSKVELQAWLSSGGQRKEQRPPENESPRHNA